MHPIKNFRCAGASACVTHAPSFSCQQLGVEGHGLLPGHAGETRVWLQNVSHTLIILPGPRGGAVRGGAGSALSILCNHPAQLNDVSLVARGHKAREGRQNLLGSARVQRWTWWPQWLRAGENLGHAAWGSGSFLRVNPPPQLSCTPVTDISPKAAPAPGSERHWATSVVTAGWPNRFHLPGREFLALGREKVSDPALQVPPTRRAERSVCGCEVGWGGLACPDFVLKM